MERKKEVFVDNVFWAWWQRSWMSLIKLLNGDGNS
jgi:hypothetical protein